MGYLGIWQSAQHILCMTDAVGIDKLRERLAQATVDALANVSAVSIKARGDVLNLQVATQVELFVVHQLVDAVHQILYFVGGGCQIVAVSN